jgi:ABC-type Zn uptake system ZnuABC Zn-binding protein ZnuA
VTARGRPRPAATAAAALCAALLAGAAPAWASPSALTVAATIFPLYDIARQVAGDTAAVTLVVSPGASPHTFDPTPSAVRALSGARLVLAVGHGLDDWVADLARRATGAERVVQVDRDLPISIPAGGDEPGGGDQARGDIDPHYWLAVPNARAIASTVAAELERLAPDASAVIRRNLSAYLERLAAVDAEVRDILADLPARRIATFHDAFGYFAAAYGLEVVAVFEPFPGREPGPRFLRSFYERVRATGVRVIFAEPQLSVDVLQPVARDLGVTISVLDPLGGVPGRESYGDLMVFNARQVAAALRRHQGE